MKLKTNITDFIEDGFGLVFVIYPEIIATFKGASIFAIIFFVMLISLGIDSAFGGMEGLYTAIIDEYPKLKTHKYLFRALISGIPFITSLSTVTYGGSFVVQWLDAFSVSPSVLVIVLVELITITWIYGIQKFNDNVYEMNSKKTFVFFQISLKFITPLCLTLIILLSMIQFKTLTVGTYTYPGWSSVVGWGINVISLLPIAIYGMYFYLFKRKTGTK